MTRLRTIIDGLGFAEAPRWHGERLWYVDYFSGEVIRATLDGTQEVVTIVPETPGGLGFLPDGTPIVVSQRDFRLLRIELDGSLTTYADLSSGMRGAANELFIDTRGRAYVGHHGFDFFGGADPAPSSLFLITPDGASREIAEDLTFPNGTALLPGGSTLIVAESFANRLTAYDVLEDGTLTGRRVWAELPGHTPDGICTDKEGCVWAASPMSGVFLRVGEGGRILDSIKTENEQWAVACAFVGEDLATLACITAATSIEAMAKGQSTASISLAQVDVAGACQ